MLSIEPIDVVSPDPGLLQEIGRLRVRAWATEVAQAAQMDVWLDEFDAIARHWIIRVDGQLAAAARLSIHQSLDDVPEAEVYRGVFPLQLPAPIASINRLVVGPEYRGRGFAKVLDRVRVAAAIVANCGSIIGETPSRRRVLSLQELGLRKHGDGACALVTGPAVASRVSVLCRTL